MSLLSSRSVESHQARPVYRAAMASSALSTLVRRPRMVNTKVKTRANVEGEWRRELSARKNRLALWVGNSCMLIPHRSKHAAIERMGQISPQIVWGIRDPNHFFYNRPALEAACAPSQGDVLPRGLAS
jgi:hypothetical protein